MREVSIGTTDNTTVEQLKERRLSVGVSGPQALRESEGD
jgi:hypothetical protein